jgi:hypothetical protein
MNVRRRITTHLPSLRSPKMAAGAAISAAAIGVAGAIPATAAPTVSLGTPQTITDGPMVATWTVSNLQPSNAMVNVPVTGKLWEATATASADQGTVTPAIPFFNARSASGQNYRALYQAPAPEAISAAPLPQGAKSTGKVYFDVTGAVPDQVAYSDAVQDRLIWN